MLLIFLACVSDVTQNIGDSGVHDHEVVGVIGLTTEPVWESEDAGYATGLSWADIDGDDDADLVVSYGNDMQRDRIGVYLNDGGELSTTADWWSEAEGYYGHIDVGDVNGDGWVDLVASRFLGDNGFDEPGGVEVFVNEEGSLSSLPSWQDDGFYTFSSALGDVDRDGDLDLAVAVGEAYYNAADVSRVYANDGTGQFELIWTTEVGRHSFDVTWVDIDGDGWLDLAFANHETPHALYKNDGAGHLSKKPDWLASGEGFEGNTIDWGDVNGDGDLDLVISDNSQLGGSGIVTIWCGPGLSECWRSADEIAMQSAVTLEDIDGDEDLDLVAGAWWGPIRIYGNDDGLVDVPSWYSIDNEIVTEAFAWANVDGTQGVWTELEGEGAMAVPGRGRVVSVNGGTAAGGWIVGPGHWSATYLKSATRDLAVSDWDAQRGVRLYGRN